jgi:probable F420-dependent oxidoreductase
MKIDANLQDPGVAQAGSFAKTAEQMGFSGVWITEVRSSPFTMLTQMAAQTSEIDIGAAIALAFPRSPMVTAYSAWDIQRFSNGRLFIGLGTQVKGHIERRFGFEWDSPGPRLRDYIRALRAIWNSWSTGDTVNFEGEFYSIDHCPPQFRPEPIEHSDIPLYIAAVNPYNLKVAGELCDGLHIHPLNSPKYIDDVVVPNVSWGADYADRNVEEITLSASDFGIIGETEAEREDRREDIRDQIAFYGSTRTYQTIFEVHGWGDICEDLHELSMNDRWDEMGDLITDEMIDTFAVEGTATEISGKLRNRYKHVDRVSIYEPFRGEAYWQSLVEGP